jgi:WD40 repeat protein/tRNA A-37 threonylcarbamoyl transferase component Bud32
MKRCPDRDLLERLLNNRLADTELDELDPHVRGCASCQQTLEELTDDTLWRSELRREIGSLFNDAEPSPAIDPLGLTAIATDRANGHQEQRAPAVPGYEITGELGRGGMGVVYKARHIRLNRECALKMILAGAHASPEHVARFVTEAEAIARLAHRSIVQIRHIGEADGLPFLELEYVSQGSLDQQLDGAPWPPLRAARLAEQVALGIAEAHRQGVVHRDLKPSNVFLAADGTPKVGDFGLAKMLDSQSALTQSESVMGSPSYMAPEQARGHAKEAGPAVDVYAVGAILYELLTGRPPFRGTTALDTLEQVETAEPVPPSRLVPGVPRDIETICLKCLQKEPGKRFETALDLADDLRRFLDGRPILARRISGAERAWRWCRRNRFVAGMAGTTAAAILILVVGATMAAFTFRAQRDHIQGADRKTREALFEALVTQAQAGRSSRRMGQRFESLDALDRAARIARELELPPDRFDRIRNEAIACFALPDLKATGRVIYQPAGTLLFCFDHGMKRYAQRHLSGTIVVRRVADDQEVARFQARGDRQIFVFAFNADGHYLTTTHFPGSALTVWDVDRNTIALEHPGPVAGAAARFSPDGRQLAIARPDGELLIYDLATRRSSRLRTYLEDVQDLAFRADGLQIAVTGQVAKQPEVAEKSRVAKQPTCQILELESGSVVRTIALKSASSVAWSPDGATLAAAGDDRKIDLWDAPSGIARARLEGSTTLGLHAAFHPAGRLMASNSWEGSLRLWDAFLGRPVLTLTGENPTEPVFSLSGQIILRSEDRLTAYQAEPALEYRALVQAYKQPRVFHRPSIRDDNRLLAVGGGFGVVLWDLARGTECTFLPGLARQVMFEASGDLLTSGPKGIQRWPVKLDADRNEFRIGPPHVLPFPKNTERIAEDRSGRIIVTPRRTYAEVLISGSVTQVGPLKECRYVAVSPDGEWLATGGDDWDAEVWRIRDGKKLAEFPVDTADTGTVSAWRHTVEPAKVARFLVNTGTAVDFSPDGRWLLTARPPCKLWATGTWDFQRELGGTGLCFSPDSRLVAILDASRIIHLVEAQTGREIARLESTDSLDVIWATFSPDGSRLVLVPTTSPAVYVWDLRKIRKRLTAIGLDWDAPAYPEADPAAASVPLLPPLNVDLGAAVGEIDD